MTVIDAVIQGVVQGLTEFLPVSSSGHLTISQHILGVTESNLFFNVMLHLGTLFAVLIVYRKTVADLFTGFIQIVKAIVSGSFKISKLSHEQKMVITLIIGLVPLFLLFVPIPGSGGLNAKDLAEIWSGATGYFIMVGAALLFTSILLMVGIAASRLSAKNEAHRRASKSATGRHSLRPLDALAVGFAQLFAAVFPGLSRSGSTLAVGQLCGLSKQTALDYSFVLGIPSILAATVLEGKDAITSGSLGDVEIIPLLVGVVVSAVVGFFAIWLFKWMLAKDRMYIFVIYTAVVGVAVVIISLVELNSGVNIFTGEALTFM